MHKKNSYRCSQCGICWPSDSRFQNCLECEGRCWLNQDEPTVTLAEALKIKGENEFEEYYQKRVKQEMQATAAHLASERPLYVSDFSG